MRKIVIIACFALLALMSFDVFGQEEDKDVNYWRGEMAVFTARYDSLIQQWIDRPKFIRYGAYGLFTANMHEMSFNTLDENICPTCNPTEYGNVMSFGYGGGGLFEYPMFNRFAGGIRAGYNDFSVNATTTESITVSDGQGNPTVMDIEHATDAALAMFTIEPLLTYRISDRFVFSVGPQLGFLMSKTFDHHEQISSPDYMVFKDGTNIRNEISGEEIPDIKSMQFGLSGGLSYEIPLDARGKIMLVPEASFCMNFTDMKDFGGTESWKMNQARVSIALKFSPHPTIDTLTLDMWDEQRKLDSITIVQRIEEFEQDSINIVQKETEKKLIADSIEIAEKGVVAQIIKNVAVDSYGNETIVEKLEIEQFDLTRKVQLLPFVFFEDGEYRLPDRYHQLDAAERANFSIKDAAAKNPVDMYYSILNIIGKRLSEDPDATITLTGCNANVGAEAGNVDLSKRRANAINYYLQDIWKIPAKKITVNTRNLPENPSQESEMNRRVEITSDSPEMLAPVMIDNQIYSFVEPPQFRSYIKVTAGAGVKQWYLEMVNTMEGFEIRKEGLGDAPEYVTWDIQDNQETVPSMSAELALTLYVQDTKGKFIEAYGAMPAEVVSIDDKRNSGQQDYKIEEYLLLIPNETKLGDNTQKILNDIDAKLSGQYPEGTRIILNGYSDDSAPNPKAIASQRVSLIKDVLQEYNIQTPDNQPFMFENNLPEQLLYNKSVKIRIEMPVK